VRGTEELPIFFQDAWDSYQSRPPEKKEKGKKSKPLKWGGGRRFLLPERPRQEGFEQKPARSRNLPKKSAWAKGDTRGGGKGKFNPESVRGGRERQNVVQKKT